MADSKFYAVKAGRKTGILKTWSECYDSVHGFSGAKYKSFKTEEEAKAYLEDTPQEINTDEKDVAVAYVDGSYNEDTKEYGSGVVLFFNGTTTELNKKGNNPELVDMRNVAGEIVGSVMAIKEAVKLHAKAIKIYHDYMGISEWALGNWKTNKVGTQQYKAFIDSAKRVITIGFEKVEAHTGDFYNERADILAKSAVGLAETELVKPEGTKPVFTAKTQEFVDSHKEICDDVDRFIKDNNCYEEFDILDMFLEERTETFIQEHQDEIAEIVEKVYKKNVEEGRIKIF